MTEKSLLDANNMSYSLATPASLVTSRSDKRLYPQQRTATNNTTMTFVLNTGTSLVDCLNSGLYLKIVPDAAARAAGFGSGSAMNLVANIRIFSRSGVELTNTTHMNLYRRTVDYYEESADWFTNTGSLMGYEGGLAQVAGAGASQESEYIIPLRKLHPFFQEMSGRFMPMNLASGLRVEIDLASPNEAFVLDAPADGTHVVVSSYTISDSYMTLQCVDLMSSAVASLNKQASTNTLEYTYQDIMTSRNSVGTSTNINISINKAVSFAMKAITVIQESADLVTQEEDSMSAAYQPATYWYSLGSQQMPSNQLIDNSVLAYMTALAAFGKLKTPSKEGNVDKTQFASATVANSTAVAAYAGFGVYAVSLERSDTLSLSSLPINSSRMLRFEATLTAAGTDFLATSFLIYLANSRNTLLNTRKDI